jgi:type I restriction enzyme, R subunit
VIGHNASDMSQTSEAAFETNLVSTLLGNGWTPQETTGWDVDAALFPGAITDFLEASQPGLWAQMRTLHGAALEGLIVAALVKELASKGSLTVLRHGFKFYGKLFRLAYFRPAHGLNPEVQRLYALNRLTVSRQVRCKPGSNQTMDVLLALNGLPVATLELKRGTDQTWRDAVRQYQTDRDARAPLFAFMRRALVHFAVDPSDVYSTTRLAGEATHFLPFNRGSNPGAVQCGSGNPPHPSGYPSGYLWHEVLAYDSFLEIIGQFLFVETDEQNVDDGQGGLKKVVTEKLVFPRYHQLDSVRALVVAARQEGPGKNYLIQHSAGSGKTNSISWLSHRLASLHTEANAKVFDCVVVITDRTVLDAQLQDAIYQIEHAQGVVKAIDEDSRQLANALIDGTQIVITTLQKFPFVLRGLLYATGAPTQDAATALEKAQAKVFEAQIANRRYAVIVDEAHSSQTGEAARELKQILGGASAPLEDDADWEDSLNAVVQSRGRQPNLSFFAFTATPKGKTLELFGRDRGNGTPEAFHVYSMRQAIEEGFILDVLRNYTTYKTYFKLLKAAENDPDLPKKKAARALAKFMSLHPHNIEQKTEVIVEHFRRSVKARLGGRAKGMVVTASRLAAVRYRLAVDRYLAAHGISDIQALVAFSGTVTDPDTGIEYTEPSMNKDVNGKAISEAGLPEKFGTADFQLLLVANKYQTGFDQPLLQAMYVDKRLDGVQAVQTLSRLNRKIPGKEDTFVLDFVNEQEDIYGAFKPYFDATHLQEASDPARLEELKHQLDVAQVYYASEVQAFVKVFFKPANQQSPTDHAHLIGLTRPALDRFKALEDDARLEFRDAMSAFVTLYAFISQIVPYTDEDQEALYAYARMLLPQLPLEGDGTVVSLGDDVALQYYRLNPMASGAISLTEGEAEGVRSPTAVGTGRVEEVRAPLSEIIDVLNTRFGMVFDDADRLFFAQIKAQALKHEGIVSSAHANQLDRFQLGIKRILESLMLERMSQNDDIVTKYMGDAEFQGLALPILAREIYNAIRNGETGALE